MAKILVIDDETILRNEVSDWLTFEGHDVTTAENGMVGVDQALRTQPDLIICDVTMPYLDGYGVLLEVHSNAATAQTPFIFVTARATHSDIRHGMNLGADDYITKPFTRMQLLEAVQTQLAKYTTREYLYQQELLQLQDALTEEKEQRILKTRLIAMFSHDFRNPLTTILSSKNLLMDYYQRMDNERRLTHYNRIETSVKQLTQMLDDMLIVSQIETGNLNLQPQSIDVGAFFHELIEEFRTVNGETHNIVFENHVASYSLADTRLLRQIGSNLISNAIKYSPHGSTVYVSLDIVGDDHIFTVRDQGIGISEDDQKQLFEAFQRGTNVGDVAGTGLGLAIVKRAVELYGGAIQMESALDQGTTMYVTFPLHPQVANQVA